MFLYRTRVQFLALSWQLTVLCNSRTWASDVLFWPLWVLWLEPLGIQASIPSAYRQQQHPRETECIITGICEHPHPCFLALERRHDSSWSVVLYCMVLAIKPQAQNVLDEPFTWPEFPGLSRFHFTVSKVGSYSIGGENMIQRAYIWDIKMYMIWT